MHYLSVGVHARVLLLCLLNAFAVHVVEQKIALNINQESIVVLFEVPARPDSLKLFYYPFFTDENLVTVFTFLLQLQLDHSSFFGFLVRIAHD